jgi:hypothetical protein
MRDSEVKFIQIYLIKSEVRNRMLKKDAGPDLQLSYQLLMFEFIIHCPCLQDTQSPHLLAVCPAAEPLHQSPELCQGIYAHFTAESTVLNDL